MHTPRTVWPGVAAVLAAYLASALLLSGTKRPSMDEAWVANPAVDLMTRGTPGVTVMEPTGSGVFVGATLTGIENHTYLWVPFAAILQSVWYRALGFGLFAVRGFSVFWGVVALLCWFYIVRKLSDDAYLALGTIALIAVDAAFLDSASDGRMDMLAASLGCCGIAAYLRFRDAALPQAILIASACATAAFLAHPVGGVAYAALAMLYGRLDRRRFLWWHPAVAMLPLMIGAAGWGWYILQRPDDFLAQNASLLQARTGGMRSPWLGIVREFTERFLGYYLPPYATGIRKIKVLILVAYLGGVAACMGVPAVRRHRAWRILVTLAPLYMLLFAIFEGGKVHYYLVYLTPPIACCLAIAVVWSWDRPGCPRWLVVSALAGLALLQIGSSMAVVARRSYQTEYLPAAHFLQEHRQSSDLVYGCGEWAFSLGFYGNFKIDTTLGYTTGRHAKFIVWEDRCMQQALDGYAEHAPAIYQYMSALLAREYYVAYKNRYYTVYEAAPSGNARIDSITLD